MYKALAVYILAAIAEIAGCYSLWSVLKLDKSPLWLIPGALSLCAFAWLLTLIDSPAAGRAYAAYGAIYIAASIGWLCLVENSAPTCGIWPDLRSAWRGLRLSCGRRATADLPIQP